MRVKRRIEDVSLAYCLNMGSLLKKVRFDERVTPEENPVFCEAHETLHEEYGRFSHRVA